MSDWLRYLFFFYGGYWPVEDGPLSVDPHYVPPYLWWHKRTNRKEEIRWET